MREKLNILKKIITNDNTYEVKYTLREDSNGLQNRMYSYCLEEYVYAEDGVRRELVEVVETPAIFEDYSIAEQFYMRMVEGNVFPQTLNDHIDDWHCAFHPSQMCDVL